MEITNFNAGNFNITLMKHARKDFCVPGGTKQPPCALALSSTAFPGAVSQSKHFLLLMVKSSPCRSCSMSTTAFCLASCRTAKPRMVASLLADLFLKYVFSAFTAGVGNLSSCCKLSKASGFQLRSRIGQRDHFVFYRDFLCLLKPS